MSLDTAESAMSLDCGDSTLVVRPLFREEGDGSIPISPLQLYFYKCNPHTAIALNKKWHSVFPKIEWENIGRAGRHACFAAEYANRYYGCAIWTRPIAANRMTDGDRLIELRRMALSPNAPKNTASRFLSFMTRQLKREQPDLVRFVSYQDTRHHVGTIYKASGWSAVSVSKNAKWNHNTRNRASPQSDAPKVRWELSA